MLTGTTIGELPQLTAITLNTLFAVEYSGLTYNLPFSLIQANVSGSSGTSGTSGTSGSSGVNGTSGTSGSSGVNGTSGSSGTSGTSGTSGSSGTSGTSGVDGQSTSYYRYLTKTTIQSGNPNSGYVIWDNLTQTGSTSININMTTSDGVDIDLFLALIVEGKKIIIQDISNANNYQTWEINGTPTQTIVSGGTNNYWTFPVTLFNSGGNGSTNFANNIPIIIAIFANSGTSGTDGTSGTSGTSGSDGTSGTSGTDGTSGTSGTDGTSGTSGTDGTSGTSGTSGTPNRHYKLGFNNIAEYTVNGGSGVQNLGAGTLGMSLLQDLSTMLYTVSGSDYVIKCRVITAEQFGGVANQVGLRVTYSSANGATSTDQILIANRIAQFGSNFAIQVVNLNFNIPIQYLGSNTNYFRFDVIINRTIAGSTSVFGAELVFSV